MPSYYMTPIGPGYAVDSNAEEVLIKTPDSLTWWRRDQLELITRAETIHSTRLNRVREIREEIKRDPKGYASDAKLEVVAGRLLAALSCSHCGRQTDSLKDGLCAPCDEEYGQ